MLTASTAGGSTDSDATGPVYTEYTQTTRPKETATVSFELTSTPPASAAIEAEVDALFGAEIGTQEFTVTQVSGNTVTGELASEAGPPLESVTKKK